MAPRKGKRVSKTEFVRSFSPSIPAKEVSAQAKKAGLIISPGYVYEIRSSLRRKKRAHTPEPIKVPSVDIVEEILEGVRTKLRGLIAAAHEIGIDEAIGVLETVRKRGAA